MTEPVRLVVWDLDDTFWRGVLCEGGVEFVEAHGEIVIELARRGIVSSILSKNDPADVEAVLSERGAWEYFVLPSISWEPKGARLRDLIETIGLRAATVLFLDDNPLNLEEARRFCPGLQTGGPEMIADLLGDPRLRGKDDRELTRLKQYKTLELRRREQSGADDQLAFLRDSGIEVVIETDVEAHIDRFVELINRTNQLNFTKQRLSENLDEARAQARVLMRAYQKQIALVRVRDKYGDHGICGAYVHNSEGRRLEQFAFSCRILGLGVERWLYQKLGRPQIAIQGETLADLSDPSPVDWVRQVAGFGAERTQEVARVGRITARGSCEIGAVVHYFRYHCDDAVGEYHVFRDGGVFRLGHSVFLYHGAHGLNSAQMAAAKRLGYVEADFATRLYDPVGRDGHLILLEFATEMAYALMRHRGSGLIVPFTVDILGWGWRDLAEFPENETPADFSPWQRDALRFAREEFDFVGLTRPRDFEALLRLTVAQIPAGARVFMLAIFSREYLHRDGKVRAAASDGEAYNGAMRAVAADHANVFVVEVDDLVRDEEIIDRLHFQRAALFRIHRRISEQALSAAEPRPVDTPARQG